MKLDLQVDTRALENKLYLLAKAAKVAPGVVIKEETKVIVKNILQLTPPKTMSQGRKAVLTDMKNLAMPITAKNLSGNASLDMGDDDGEGDTPWRKRLAKLLRKKDKAGIEAMMRNAKSSFWRNRSMIVSRSELVGVHLRNRTPYGRTRRQFNMAFKKDWRAHLKEIQSRVGWAKAGWVAIADKVGLPVKPWLRRLAGVSGAAIASFGEKASVFAINYNVKIPGYQRTVQDAVNSRVNATSTKINRLVAGKAVNLGFKVVEGTR